MINSTDIHLDLMYRYSIFTRCPAGRLAVQLGEVQRAFRFGERPVELTLDLRVQ